MAWNRKTLEWKWEKEKVRSNQFNKIDWQKSKVNVGNVLSRLSINFFSVSSMFM